MCTISRLCFRRRGAAEVYNTCQLGLRDSAAKIPCCCGIKRPAYNNYPALRTIVKTHAIQDVLPESAYRRAILMSALILDVNCER
ncbi:hypothetical protein J6590_050054 [Homalodisca vitripennis]|nr:hypothetical protein J6590_050054 [Homalodisca vitripennis]